MKKEYLLDEEDYMSLVEAAKGDIVGKWKKDGSIEDGKAARIAHAWLKISQKYKFDPWSIVQLTYNKILAEPLE